MMIHRHSEQLIVSSDLDPIEDMLNLVANRTGAKPSAPPSRRDAA